MNPTRLHRLAAGLVFLYALFLYGSTVAPTTSLWDSGEFIASAYGLQVMHPPGAPFYMILGRFFSMFIPPAQVALAVNMISVLASAATVLLTYLIIVQLVRAWQGTTVEAWTLSERATAVGGGLIGACTLAVTDSFWFNAVEAEVYALSLLFTALPIWLALTWSERVRREAAADAPLARRTSDRYLLLIAYLFGLAIGVHLMALLTFFFISLIFFFTRIDRPGWTVKQRGLTLLAFGGASAIAFTVLYPGVVIVLPDLAGRSGVPFLFGMAVCTLLLGALVYTYRKGFAQLHLALLCVTMLLAGYSSYALIPIRSAADPVIDLNNPETIEALIPYLKREQFGTRPLLYGATFDNRTGRLDLEGAASLFPRRNSLDPAHQRLYARYDSDAAYFWDYQLGYMYTRYFLWNFAGRAKDEQGSAWITGLADGEAAQQVYTTPSEAASRNLYFALPLLLGLFGLLYHLRRDGRRALAVLILFLATGLGLVIYLNEIPQTPRERDYIYVASYFAFALWVGVGAGGLLEGLGSRLHLRNAGSGTRKLSLAALGLVLFATVPLWMLLQNYDDHDRSGRFLARDFAYNMLMSVEDNAILFTEGDNDTYPLWYLQEVEGVRRDVRVVNLALLQAPWYARQLKTQQAYDAAPLPISLSLDEIDQINVMAWQPSVAQLPVDTSRLLQHPEIQISVEDTVGLESPMQWTVEGRPYNEEIRILYPADQIVLDVLSTNARQGWERPVYFAATTAPTSQIDLQPYFQREGLAYRVVPLRHAEPLGRVVPELMLKRLASFRFARLNDPDVYFDPQSRGLAGFHYRLPFALTAQELVRENRPQEAKKLLDDFLDAVPPDTIPLSFLEGVSLAQVYQRLGEDTRTIALLHSVEPYMLHNVRVADTGQGLTTSVRQVQDLQRIYLRSQAFEEASALSHHLADLLHDEDFRMSPEEMEQLYDDILNQTGEAGPG